VLNAMMLKRRLAPEDPVGAALVFFSLVAASGFAVGWTAQALGGF
jgi:hypothetical protein